MKKPLKYLIIAVLASLLTLTACGADETPANNIGEIELVDSDPFAHLRIQFVGAAHETQAVVNALQLPGENWIVGFIQIGQDHGDFAESYSPYTLTIFYEPRSGSVIEGSRELPTIPTVVFEENSTLLFEVIENLQAVTFSVRFNPAQGGEADNGFFDYRWSRSRHGEYSLQFGNESENVSDFAIHIDLISNVNLGFNVLHEVNYNDAFEEIRGFRFDGEGERLVIWANQPIFNLSLIALDHSVVDFHVAEAVFSVDKLDSAAAHAFVINSYYGVGTMPWSGIAFEDVSGARRYYMLQQSGYDGRFFLNEFEPAVAIETSIALEAWQEAYAALLRRYATEIPNPNEGYTERSFILHDIDRNGVPELLITYIAAGIWGESLYTFVDGEVLQLEFFDGFFAYFDVFIRPNTNGIITRAYGDIILMQIDGVSILAEVRLRSPFFPEDAGWYINGRAVTEDEHDDMLNTMLLGGWDNVERIWPYELTEANIQNVVFR